MLQIGHAKGVIIIYHYLDHREGSEIHGEDYEVLNILMRRVMKILKHKWGGS